MKKQRKPNHGKYRGNDPTMLLEKRQEISRGGKAIPKKGNRIDGNYLWRRGDFPPKNHLQGRWGGGVFARNYALVREALSGLNIPHNSRFFLLILHTLFINNFPIKYSMPSALCTSHAPYENANNRKTIPQN